MKKLIKHNISRMLKICSFFLVAILCSSTILNGQENEMVKDEKINQHTAILQNILNLDDDQILKYVHPFWYEYQALERKAEVHKGCPHFPKPILNTSGVVQNKLTAMHEWMANYPNELKAMENIFHPNITFRHEKMEEESNQ